VTLVVLLSMLACCALLCWMLIVVYVVRNCRRRREQAISGADDSTLSTEHSFDDKQVDALASATRMDSNGMLSSSVLVTASRRDSGSGFDALAKRRGSRRPPKYVETAVDCKSLVYALRSSAAATLPLRSSNSRAPYRATTTSPLDSVAAMDGATGSTSDQAKESVVGGVGARNDSESLSIGAPRNASRQPFADRLPNQPSPPRIAAMSASASSSSSLSDESLIVSSPNGLRRSRSVDPPFAAGQGSGSGHNSRLASRNGAGGASDSLRRRHRCVVSRLWVVRSHRRLGVAFVVSVPTAIALRDYAAEFAAKQMSVCDCAHSIAIDRCHRTTMKFLTNADDALIDDLSGGGGESVRMW
jgi:hypothetical protein